MVITKEEIEELRKKGISERIVEKVARELPLSYQEEKMLVEKGFLYLTPGVKAKMVGMPSKEIEEAERAGIPSNIIFKFVMGMSPTKEEKEIIRKHGKVYVMGHRREEGKVIIYPQLRNLPR